MMQNLTTLRAIVAVLTSLCVAVTLFFGLPDRAEQDGGSGGFENAPKEALTR